MRHSRVDLTMNIYTAPRSLDVAGAVDALPDMPLSPDADRPPLPALSSLVPVLVLTARQPCEISGRT